PFVTVNRVKHRTAPQLTLDGEARGDHGWAYPPLDRCLLCDWLQFAFGRCGPVPVALREEFGAFDADVGHESVEPPWHVPVELAHHDHQCGHQQAADDGGVEDHCDGESDPELFDGRVAVEHEASEHEHHDQCCCGDHAGAGHEAVDDRGLVVFAGV